MDTLEFNLLKIDLKNAIRLNQQHEIDHVLDKMSVLVLDTKESTPFKGDLTLWDEDKC